MHHTTAKKISFLQAYIRRNFKRLQKYDPGNIRGIRVDKKVVAGKTKPHLSIVFNVEVKRPEEEITKKNKFPKELTIAFPGGEKKRIKTDVVQTGKFRLHFSPTNQVIDPANGEQGTAGPFVHNGAHAFLLTCYHVAANHYYRAGKLSYNNKDGGPIQYVDVQGAPKCQLIVGEYSNRMDAALVWVGDNVPVQNVFPDGAPIFNKDYVHGPIDPGRRGRPLYLYPPSKTFNRTVVPMTENDMSYPAPDIQFDNVIYVPLCTELGDSGSAVVDETHRLIGIVIGGDDNNTYITPYYKITDLVDLPII